MSLKGVPLLPTDQVALTCRTLPMCFVLGRVLAQTSTLRSSQLCNKLAGATELHDRGDHPVLEQETLLYYVYPDNIGILGLEADLVDDSLDQVEKQFDGLGLDTHEKGGAYREAVGILIGLCTFIELLGLNSLNCLHTVYKFIQSGYDERRRLRASVAAELRAFRGLLFVLESDWHKPWSPESFCSDAFETDWGVCEKMESPDVLAKFG